MPINFVAFIIGFVSSVIFILLGRQVFLKVSHINKTRFVLERNGNKVVKLGGLALFLGLIAQAFIFSKSLFLNYKLAAILTSSFLMLILGMLDDWLEFKVWQKFLGELLIALVFIFTSGIVTEIVFLNKQLNFLVTLVWILGITNAFNLLDILDGLACGVGLLISAVFLYLAYITGNLLVGILSFLLLGPLIATLIFNFPSAKIYLGDSGSLFLGFIFSTLAISTSYAKTGHEMALLSPVFILGFPIYDTIFVSLMRIIQGKPIFRKTDDHFVFKLIAMGKNSRRALFICYLITIASIITGFLFTKLSNVHSLFLVIIALCLLVLISFRVGKVDITN